MSIHRLIAIPLLAALACACGSEPGAPPSETLSNAPSREVRPGVTVVNARLLLPSGSRTAGAVFFDITNARDRPVVLNDISLEGAGKAQLHDTVIDEGVAEMVTLGALPIAQGQTIVMGEKGKHFRIAEIGPRYQPGGFARLTLSFEDGHDASVNARIERAGRTATIMDHAAMH